MEPYLTLIEFQEGRTTYYGPPIPFDVSKRTTTDKQAAALRKEAQENFTNIDQNERQRRSRGGDIALVLSALYALYAHPSYRTMVDYRDIWHDLQSPYRCFLVLGIRNRPIRDYEI